MLDKLLVDGWDYHDRESERLAGELEAACIEGVSPAQLPAFVHLATHTMGQHLRDWRRALALGRRVVEAQPPGANIGDVWGRLYVAATMAGDAIGAARFELSSLKVANDSLANLISMRLLLADVLIDAGRVADGRPLFVDALALLGRMEAPEDLQRRVAATSNNIAWVLHDLPSRSEPDVALMRLAAQTSLASWQRCGDWINVELAYYLNASIASREGESVSALNLSGEGLQLIAANGKRPFDTARFHLLRAISFAALNRPQERIRALAEADDAAGEIAFEGLKRQFLAARERAL